MTSFPPRPFRAAVGIALLLIATPAIAGPNEEVKTAMGKFLTARSYRAEMHSSGPQSGTVSMDYVAPDRYRMQTPAGTQTIIGDAMHLQVGGRSMRIPMPKGTLSQWRDPAQVARNQAGMRVTPMGVAMLDGQPARKYRVNVSDPAPSSSTMWIGGNGYPLQIVVASKVGTTPVTTTIRYSRFNDPTLQIAAPK